MLYRVDYLLAVIFLGALAGAFFGKRMSSIESGRLARGYYVTISILLLVRAVAIVGSIVLGNGSGWVKVGSFIGDAGNFLFGALFGIAMRRSNSSAFLREPAFLSSLCLWSGFAFVISGYTKAFYMQAMSDFFTQSGYSIAFLKFIMTIEVLGGIALVVPGATIPALAGLSIDMFGAVYTHIHNGDPIHDSTGAIGQLIRLGVIVALWVLQRESGITARYLRNAMVGVIMAAFLSLGIAVTGSILLRHASTSGASIR
jgi:uncharacterized membrane protein YphA (DoxX/SURF4 family)